MKVVKHHTILDSSTTTCGLLSSDKQLDSVLSLNVSWSDPSSSFASNIMSDCLISEDSTSKDGSSNETLFTVLET